MENFINKLRELSIEVEVVDGQLKLQIPETLDATDIIQEVRDNKEALISFIQKAKGATKYKRLPIAPKKEFYASSSAQKRLYFLTEFNKDSLAYNMPRALELKGKIDKDRLSYAFNQLIARHEVLRTSIHFVDKKVVQKVAPSLSLEIDFAYATPAEVDTLFFEFIRPFDLGTGPLLRVKLLEVSPEEYFLLVDMHHIITDGVSHGILMKDFMAFYKGETFPPLSFQYKDYAEWQQGEEQQESLAKQKTFWLEAFSEESDFLDLPLDFERPLNISYEGQVLNFNLNKETIDHLKGLAARKKTTLFTVTLSIFVVLLNKLSGQEDIIVGTPVAGRGHPDLGNIFGLFVNTLPLRTYPKGALTYNQFLDDLRSRLLQYFDNQSFQYEDLIEALNVDRNTSRNPLFDVMFSYENFEEPTFEFPGLSLGSYSTGDLTSKFDLTLTAIETPEALQLSIEYTTALFKKETIEKFINYFKKIVSTIIADENIALTAIDILSPKEKERLLVELNPVPNPFPSLHTILDLFDAQAAATPNNIALQSQTRTLSYQELKEQSDQVAAYLVEKEQLKVGDFVGILLEREMDLLPLIYGILKAGCAYIPIDTKNPVERINTIIKESGLKVLVTRKTFENTNLTNSCKTIHLDDLPTLIEKSNLQSIPVKVEATDLAYVMFTSGSTGKPKGVMIEHRSLSNFIQTLDEEYPLQETDSFLLKTTYTFDISVAELFGWFLNGGSLTLLPVGAEGDADVILETIAQYGISHMNFVPSMFSVFIAGLNEEKLKMMDSLSYIISGGEELPQHLVRQFNDLNTNIKFENLYGPTEATIYCARYSTKNYRDASIVPIGKPIKNLSAYILDSNNHLQLEGVPGELCIGGVGVARGYLNDQVQTDAKFIANPFKEGERIYKTNDLARWLPDGNIEYLGRMDNQIKIRGFRIELGEIESQLLSHEQITETAVVVKGENESKELVAYYISKEEIATSELITHLSKVLVGYMIPSFYVHMDVFPLTHNGKLNRKALPDPEIKVGQDYQAPATEKEELIVGVWAEVLHLDKSIISTGKNFFELGGNSLKMLVVKNIIYEKFNLKLNLADFFKYNTIEKFAGFLDREEWLMSNQEDSIAIDSEEIFID